MATEQQPSVARSAATLPGITPPAVAQDLSFVASFAADMTSPVIFFICSLELVNWVLRNFD
jgi:hypothetical protein